MLSYSSANLSLLTYGYDNDDNIVSIADGVNSAASMQYGYDNMGRLSQSVASTGTVKRFDYRFDKNGNRTAVEQRANANDATPLATDTYALAAGTNRLASIASASGARAIGYDARGNTLSETRPGGATVAATYDGYGRLLTYARTGDPAQSNAYNGLDERVKATRAGTTHTYVYDPDGRLMGEYAASATAPVAETIWLGLEVANDNEPIGGDDGVGGYAPLGVATGSGSSAALYWVHGNHLGVPLITTDSSGALASCSTALCGESAWIVVIEPG